MIRGRIGDLQPRGRAGDLAEPAELIANVAGIGAPNGSLTGSLPKFAPPVLEITAIGPDQKNDHASGGTSNRRAHHRTPWTARRANQSADAGAKPGAKQHIALKI